LSRWVKEHHEPQSEYAVLEVRFEPGTPQIWSRILIHSIAEFEWRQIFTEN
jgi:hypothetical protein